MHSVMLSKNKLVLFIGRKFLFGYRLSKDPLQLGFKYMYLVIISVLHQAVAADICNVKVQRRGVSPVRCNRLCVFVLQSYFQRSVYEK